MPPKPIIKPKRFCQVLRAIFSILVTALAWPYRPINSSAINAGYAKQKASTKYTRTKAAPPLLAVWVGKPQILPKPTADPAAAIIKPIRELKPPLETPIYFPKIILMPAEQS